MNTFEKEFDSILDKARSAKHPVRVVIAGATAENILKAVFEAEAEGFVTPVLVGREKKVYPLLEKLGYDKRSFQFCDVPKYENVVQHAIDVINMGMGDVLMRGDTSTRDFLMPIINKGNKLMKNSVVISRDLLGSTFHTLTSIMTCIISRRRGQSAQNGNQYI